MPGAVTWLAGTDASGAITATCAGALAPTADCTSAAGALHELMPAQSPKAIWPHGWAGGASPQSCCAGVSITMLMLWCVAVAGAFWDMQPTPWLRESRVSEAVSNRPVNRRSMDTMHCTCERAKVAVGP